MEPELLKKKIKVVRNKQRWKRLALKISFGIVLCLGVLMGLLSSYSFSVALANKNLSQKIDQAKKKIENFKEIESKQIYLFGKLESFKTLIKLQARHQATAETIFSLIPNGTSLEGFEVKEDGIILLSGSVPDWPTLTELFNKIKKTQTKLKIVSAEVNKISFDSNGEISFNIALNLAGGKIVK